MSRRNIGHQYGDGLPFGGRRCGDGERTSTQTLGDGDGDEQTVAGAGNVQNPLGDDEADVEEQVGGGNERKNEDGQTDEQRVSGPPASPHQPRTL